MQFRVRLPGWAAAVSFVLWATAAAYGIVAAHYSIAANRLYLESGGMAPTPPPYSGQPAMRDEPDTPTDVPDGRPKKRLLPGRR